MNPKLTLRDLFWLVLVVALALGWWLDRIERPSWRTWFSSSQAQHTKVYYVGEMIPVPLGAKATLQYAALVNEIKANVEPGTWESAGGNATIAAFDTNASLVIQHDERGHEKVKQFLDAKRAELTAKRVDD